jgi:aspartate/methionine/tyrosine aminotransferase
VSQQAALACFTPESLAIYEQRRAEFKVRRDYFIPALNALGLTVPVMPDGAFYAWADCSAACEKLGLKDSWDFAHAALHQAHVAITPGRDFGNFETARFVRFSTANSMAELKTAIERLKAWLQP